MPEPFASTFAVPAAAALGGSFLLEPLLQPRPGPPWRRPLATLLLHTGIVAILFALELLLFRRPWFAAVNVLALLLFVVLVSNAKFHSLREPFICQDFEYFSDALRHPRLYIPFLGLGRALLAGLSIIGAIGAGMLLEPPQPTIDALSAVVLFLITGAALLLIGSNPATTVRCHPESDLHEFGFLAGLWLYGRDERQPLPRPLPSSALFCSPPAATTGTELPDMVAVQSESFFDPRHSYPFIRPDVLAEYDRMKATSLAHGRLRVPAWGANTVRTEFAFLSGVAPDTLGIHQFNPYRRFARQGIPTLASWLRRLGYRTICIHPYSASFYNRDKVYPLLGFDEFIDIRGFSSEDVSGPYTGDLAVAEKVTTLLAQRRRAGDPPLFIFVITMENHGPLHLEKPDPKDGERFYLTPPPAGCDDLTVYLRHLKNADRMVGMLRDALETSPREGVLCFFGDHLPIMADVYRALGEPGGCSEYLLWSNRNSAASGENDLDVRDLGETLLKQAGLVKQ